MKSISWIHVSDWHQRGRDFDRRIVRDALMVDLQNRKKISTTLEHISFAVFSGDVAFSGKAEEYEAARKEFFDPLLRATDLGKAGRANLYITPGNHDVNRDAFELGPSDLASKIHNQETVTEWLTDLQKRRVLMEPFTAYSEFINRYLGPYQDFRSHHPAYWFPRSLKVADHRISILCLNSALLSGRSKHKRGGVNDYGCLILGKPQLEAALDEARRAELRIMVMHHPFDWFAEWDRNCVEERISKTCDFALFGHQQFPQLKVQFSTIGSLIEMPTGASYDRRPLRETTYSNAYTLTHLDHESGQATVYFRRWSSRLNEWIADTESAQDGAFEFTLPSLTSVRGHISVAIVLKDDKVLLVRRREKEGPLHWQFPGGLVKRKGSDREVAEKETLDEANVRCHAKEKVGQRIHPDTRALVHYWLCDYVRGIPKVKDSKDLDRAEWIDRRRATNMITSDLYPEAKKILSSS